MIEAGATTDAPLATSWPDDQAALDAAELGWDVLSSLFPGEEEDILSG